MRQSIFYIFDKNERTPDDKFYLVKLGTTRFPIARKRQYRTGCGSICRYLKYYVLDIQDKKKLYYLDSVEFPRWLIQNNLNHKYTYENGEESGREWYKYKDYDTRMIVDYLPILEEFFKHKNIKFEGPFDDEFPRTEEDDDYDKNKTNLAKEDRLKEQIYNGQVSLNESRVTLETKVTTLSEEFRQIAMDPIIKEKKKFIEVINNDNDLRSIQDEFWNLFYEKLEEKIRITGVVKYPTGVGKSLTICISVFLTYQKLQDEGKLFRGVLICPQNGIFKTNLEKYKKLEKLINIQVIEGFGGGISKLQLPSNKSYLLLVTHQGCNSRSKSDKTSEEINERFLEKNKDINYVIYDEVHHITGDILYEQIKKMMIQNNNLKCLIGCSATPITNNNEQKKKIKELFTENYILQECDYLRAIENKWIIQPKFYFYIVKHQEFDKDEYYSQVISKLKARLDTRISENNLDGGKVMIFVPENTSQIDKAVRELRKRNYRTIYSANDENVEGAKLFNEEEMRVNDTDKDVKFLVSCRKNLEGFDSKGVDLSCVSFNSNIEPYRLLQIAGRSMRNDYDHKISDCMIFKESNNSNEKIEEMIFKIFKQLVEELEIKDVKKKEGEEVIINVGKISKIMNDFIGEISIDERIFTVDQSIRFIQRLYYREIKNENEKKRLSYRQMINHNRTFDFVDKTDYEKRRVENEQYLKNPLEVYEKEFRSWYEFLGKNLDEFYSEKEFLNVVKKCKRKSDYNKMVLTDKKLPKSYTECYNFKYGQVPWECDD